MVLRGTQLHEGTPDDEGDSDNGSGGPSPLIHVSDGEYVAGKWGRYVRAPNFYFEIMQRFGRRFAPLGTLAAIRRGITSGCDAFFMPRDVTEELLRECNTPRIFRQRSGGAPRKDVESRKLVIIQAGDGSVHPVEAEFLAPEVHSLMKVDRPVVHARDLDRLVLLVSQSMKDLRGTWVHKYLKYGEQATFASKKSKPVPVPQRSTCAARDPWYDLTKLAKPGFAFWPMAQQYRHIIAGNPERLVCNHNLFDLRSDALKKREEQLLWGVLNSTLVGLFKNFCGRFAGTEGNLKTEVVDVNLLEVPDPRGIDPSIAKKLTSAVKAMSRRTVGRLIEEQLMDCHSPEWARRLAAGPLFLSLELQQEDRRALDDAVFELLGVNEVVERSQLVQQLHEATALHFRHIRVVEIEKQEQRTRSASKRFSVQELAADAWDAAELEDATPLDEWLGKQPECTAAVNVPDERPAMMSPSPMFDPDAVYFGKKQSVHVDCQSNGQAKVVVQIANLGISGWVKVPEDNEPCLCLRKRVAERVSQARKRFGELADSRTSDPRIQAQIVDQLMRWFTLGKAKKERSDATALM